MPLIQFSHVSKFFRKNEVLKGIDLSIDEGDLFGIIGVSGAGKTTLLRTLVGYYKADSGNILFKGEDISKNIGLIKRIFGFTSQDYSFYEKLSLYENLRYFGRMYSMDETDIKNRAAELLELTELKEHSMKLASELSGGMRRRLDMACSLMHSPKILIMDEPTTGLDPVLRKHMLKLIKKINDSGTTVIISSHLLGEIEYICNKVAILHKGSILVEDTPEKLKDRFSRNEEIHLETFPAEYEKLIKLIKKHKLAVPYIHIHKHKLVIYSPRAEIVLHYILHLLEEMNETLLDVHVNKPSLAEVFEALTQGKKELAEETEQNPYEEMKANIKSAIEHGYSTDEIEKEMKNAGYKKRIIDKLLNDLTSKKEATSK